MNPSIRLKKASALFLVVLGCFALESIAQGQLPPPPPDGGYPGGNTAEGNDALFFLTTGVANTAIGFQALNGNTTGMNNTATGVNVLFSNTTGVDNTANGYEALFKNTIGGSNTATGFEALFNNTTGSTNTATGLEALFNNTTGGDNTASGSDALFFNTTGGDNTASGFDALFNNTTGGSNTATGFQALFHNTIGNNNIGLGNLAGQHITTGSSNIDIGNVGVAGESNHIRIGTENMQTATFIAGIYNVSEGGTIKPVYINSAGRLGTQPPASARKFKEEIKAMEKTSEGILNLKPVTFRYKNDEERTPQFGLIAEEVAKVNPDLVVRDETGEIYSVRYEAVNAMLLNEFLKEHRKVLDLETIVAQQQKQVEALTAGLQKVSAQTELNKPAPQTVLNHR